MTDSTIEDKLNAIEQECDTYLASLGLKVKHNPEFDLILNQNLDSLRLLDEEQCSEYSVLAAIYAAYIQGESNRHSRKLKWAEHNLSIVVGKYAKNYGNDYTKYEEKKACIICENPYATKLNEIIKISMVYSESLNFMSRKIEAVSNTLLELKRSKRKTYGQG